MAGKFSIYKYVKLEGKGWRYARAAFHSNGKIKPNIVLVKGASVHANSASPLQPPAAITRHKFAVFSGALFGCQL